MRSGGLSWVDREGFALLTDLYELTMVAGYFREGRDRQQACFEYFFRSLPPHAGFAVSTGLDSFLSYVENLRFHEDDLDYLRSLGTFQDDFVDSLQDFGSQCAVYAVPEGTLMFPHEPVIRVEGPILHAQLFETALLNLMNFPTLIATKAARICLAAEGEPVLEFGLRRAHGPDGGLSGSRAAYIGGCASTSNVLTGKVHDIPVSGTHAHSWVMSFPSELESFRAFAKNFPDTCVLLVDTYDTLESGVPNAIQVFKEMREQGYAFRAAVRLDSGDLAKLSKETYRMMTEAGFEDPLIVASGDLDEDLIADMKRQGAKINAWGVGAHLITAHDSPSLNGVYKLVAVGVDDEWEPRIKISSNLAKATNPGAKRVVRYFDANDAPLGDVLYLLGEDWPDSGTVTGRQHSQPHVPRKIRDAARCEDLLKCVYKDGKRRDDRRPASEIRDDVLGQISRLPEEYKRLRNPEIYRVMLSEQLGDKKDQLLLSPDSA